MATKTAPGISASSVNVSPFSPFSNLFLPASPVKTNVAGNVCPALGENCPQVVPTI